MEALVGLETGGQTSLPISASDIRKWAQAFTSPRRRPVTTGTRIRVHHALGGLVAPRSSTFAWMTAAGPPSTQTFDVGSAGHGRRGHVRGGVAGDEVPAERRDLLTILRSAASTRVTECGFAPSAGRLGLMLFTYNETEWTNQRAEWIKTTRGTGIRY
jgi:hypothetical protein